MHWFIDPIKNHYADFEGRATRKQFWMFTLYYALFLVILFIIPILTYSEETSESDTLFIGSAIIAVVGILGTTIPVLAIQVRRLHDIDLSGWWYFVNFIPYIGSFILLAMSCVRSQSGTNEWGPNAYEVTEPTTKPAESTTTLPTT